jgi:hypothetical protein
VAALRDAFDAMTKDALFLAEASQLRIDVHPAGGRQIESLVREIYALPESVIAQTKRVATIDGPGR